MKQILFFYLTGLSMGVQAKTFLPLSCGGFEPSWSLSLSQNEMILSYPDMDGVAKNNIKVLTVKSTIDKIEIKGKLPTGKPFSVIVTENKKCVDEGSGAVNKNTHSVHFQLKAFGNEVISGCCKPLK